MIRPCTQDDFEDIFTIINDAAMAYQGIIPEDRWRIPYMPRAELRHEIASGVEFWGYEEAGALIGVMGMQDVQDVTLMRHAYVRTDHRNRGIGSTLLQELRRKTVRPVFIGTWAAADWAVRFYERHGYRRVTPAEKDLLLRKYWSIPDRQVETSVVLADRKGLELIRQACDKSEDEPSREGDAPMSSETIRIENRYLAPFADKTPLAVTRGEGVYVWDEDGRRYLDFTAGWGVTCLGHASPVITAALLDQSRKIIQNPNSGATYSPARAKLLDLMHGILPANLTRIFFTNSGAEANDAALKLARKASGKRTVISAAQSFHGRTISTVSATGQRAHLERFRPLMPNHAFVPFGDYAALAAAIDDDTAAVILEPIQGEGGVNVPPPDYLPRVSELCARHNVYLIVDEIQTGFFRTGPLFASAGVRVDIMTMAKGIAGGFPFGAFALTEEIADKLEKGDHGGTYCGNPLGCAVSHAVIKHLLDARIGGHVERMGASTLDTLRAWQKAHPTYIRDVRGRGLLIALELASEDLTARVNALCLINGLILNVKHGRIIRIFPALTITPAEMDEGLATLKSALETSIT